VAKSLPLFGPALLALPLLLQRPPTLGLLLQAPHFQGRFQFLLLLLRLPPLLF
jgi:hypothetical protein